MTFTTKTILTTFRLITCFIIIVGVYQEMEEFVIRKKPIKILQDLSEYLHLISDDKYFESKHGFTIDSYIAMRDDLAKMCQDLEQHIRLTVRNTGIAKVTGGTVGIASGTCAILGLILAPFTFGASIGLSIAGISGGIASAATTAGSAIAQHAIINKAKKQFKEFLEQFESQELVVIELFENFYGAIEELKLCELNGEKVPGLDEKIFHIITSVVCLVRAFAWKGFDLGKAIFRTVRIIEETAELGPAVAAKALAATTSTTAKVFSGIFAGVGIGVSIYDIYDGAKDIINSKCADGFKEFNEQYESNTKIMMDQRDSFIEFNKKYGPSIAERIQGYLREPTTTYRTSIEERGSFKTEAIQELSSAQRGVQREVETITEVETIREFQTIKEGQTIKKVFRTKELVKTRETTKTKMTISEESNTPMKSIKLPQRGSEDKREYNKKSEHNGGQISSFKPQRRQHRHSEWKPFPKTGKDMIIHKPQHNEKRIVQNEYNRNTRGGEWKPQNLSSDTKGSSPKFPRSVKLQTSLGKDAVRSVKPQTSLGKEIVPHKIVFHKRQGTRHDPQKLINKNVLARNDAYQLYMHSRNLLSGNVKMI